MSETFYTKVPFDTLTTEGIKLSSFSKNDTANVLFRWDTLSPQLAADFKTWVDLKITKAKAARKGDTALKTIDSWEDLTYGILNNSSSIFPTMTEENVTAAGLDYTTFNESAFETAMAYYFGFIVPKKYVNNVEIYIQDVLAEGEVYILDTKITRLDLDDTYAVLYNPGNLWSAYDQAKDSTNTIIKLKAE